MPFLKDSLFLISCCRNEQSCTQFPGVRSWERVTCLVPSVTPSSDLTEMWSAQLCGPAMFSGPSKICLALFLLSCFFFFFNCLKMHCMKIYKHAFLQTKHPCFTLDLGSLCPSSHWLQSPGPDLQRPWQSNREYIHLNYDNSKNTSRNFSGTVEGSVGPVQFLIVPCSNLYFFSRSIGPFQCLVNDKYRVLICCSCHFQSSSLFFVHCGFLCLQVWSVSNFHPDTKGRMWSLI